MDASRFDRFTRALTTASSRRIVLQSLVATVLGLTPVPPPSAVHARKRKSKLQRNAFGCVDVGGKCRGKDSVCCSGICRGKKPEKGKRDRSRCVGHHVDICTTGQDACAENFAPATECSLANPDCFCGRTTGSAGFCGDFNPSVQCFPFLCRSDPDCEKAGFPSGSACVQFVEPGCACPATGTACVPPCA